MLRIIPNKNNIGAEIDTDLQKISIFSPEEDNIIFAMKLFLYES